MVLSLKTLIAVGAEELAVSRWSLGTSVLFQRIPVSENQGTETTPLLGFSVDSSLMHDQKLLRVKESTTCQASVTCDVCKEKETMTSEKV